jgi:hypothetical protein
MRGRQDRWANLEGRMNDFLIKTDCLIRTGIRIATRTGSNKCHLRGDSTTAEMRSLVGMMNAGHSIGRKHQDVTLQVEIDMEVRIATILLGRVTFRLKIAKWTDDPSLIASLDRVPSLLSHRAL